LTVTYEDLVADMSGAAAAILRFLDLELPVDHVVVPRTRRQADELNEEWTSRYHARATSAP
jgi:LPS sulfotransferase NodH